MHSRSMQVSRQALLDDWGPKNTHDWFDTSRDSWHYDPATEDEVLALKEAAGDKLVVQTLSSATGKCHDLGWIAALGFLAGSSLQPFSNAAA
jgi:hypothetical protein